MRTEVVWNRREHSRANPVKKSLLITSEQEFENHITAVFPKDTPSGSSHGRRHAADGGYRLSFRDRRVSD